MDSDGNDKGVLGNLFLTFIGIIFLACLVHPELKHGLGQTLGIYPSNFVGNVTYIGSEKTNSYKIYSAILPQRVSYIIVTKFSSGRTEKVDYFPPDQYALGQAVTVIYSDLAPYYLSYIYQPPP